MEPRQERTLRHSGWMAGRSVAPTRHSLMERIMSQRANLEVKRADSLFSIDTDPTPVHPSHVSRMQPSQTDG